MAMHTFVNIDELFNVFSLLLLLAAIIPWIHPLHVKEQEHSILPRPIPYRLPFFKSTFSFLFDGAKLLSHAS